MPRWPDRTASPAWSPTGDRGSVATRTVDAAVTSLAFLVDQLFSPTPGGMGTYVRELVPALSRADPSLELTLFHSRFDADSPEDLLALYPTVELAASIRRLYPSWVVASRPSLPSSLASKDLVHSPVPAAVPPKAAGQR